ncbi:MAG: sporulation protein YqfC [Bacillaceae bacterium G1]|nr:sporulation protein YqfC [Bacillota bacterium]OJF18001.1 MAG: sporulation protein YqfC [Bacillaceae bacterium G1]
MNRWAAWKKRLGSSLDVPLNTILNIPRVTVIGTYQVYVENHQGILEFSSQRLRLRTVAGQLQITGQGLMIRQINHEEIFVEGERIASLTFTEQA